MYTPLWDQVSLNVLWVEGALQYHIPAHPKCKCPPNSGSLYYICGLVDDNIHLTRINSLLGKCTLPDITEEYVQKQISSMSVGKATGPDGISVQMLQIASRYITESLTHIFNLSIRCEHYPKDWKYALVTSIHKGGDKCNTTNYRPISILPIISKILERWVHSVVYSYLDECNLIPCCQSGFRPLHST